MSTFLGWYSSAKKSFSLPFLLKTFKKYCQCCLIDFFLTGLWAIYGITHFFKNFTKECVHLPEREREEKAPARWSWSCHEPFSSMSPPCWDLGRLRTHAWCVSQASRAKAENAWSAMGKYGFLNKQVTGPALVHSDAQVISR